MRFFSFLGSSFRVAPSTPWVVELELYGIIWHYGGQGVGTCLGFFRVALSNRLAVFVFSFPVSTFSTKWSCKCSCVLAMNCYDLLNLFWASRFTTRPIPAALTPRREARCVPPHPLIAWSLWINRCKSGCWETDPPAVLRFGFLKPKVKWRSEGPRTHRVTVSS